MNNKTFIIVVTILTMVAIFALASYLPARTDAGLRVKIAEFPKTIAGWQGKDLPLTELDYEILETKNLFVRDYKNQDGESVYLYLVYSEDNRKVSHPPEVCFMGSGATIVQKDTLQVTDSIKATQMVVEKADSRQLVVYWYKAGGLYTNKYLRQQLKVVIERMLGRRTSGALIRVSTEIKDDGKDTALTLIRLFCAQIEPLLTKYVP